MPKGEAIDLDALHALLLERAGRLGKVKIHQRDLAAELGVTHFAICRVLARMEEEGRIKRIGQGYKNVGLYAVKPLSPN